MDIFHHHSPDCKRLAVFFLCLSILAGIFPAPVQAADSGLLLSSIVSFESITLHYVGPDGQSVGAEVEDNALIAKDDKLVLRYTYAISEEQCKQIKAGVDYFLDVSPHLTLPHLESGSPLILEGETEPFGYICADGSRAWVRFLSNEDSTGTILSGYGGIENADFHLTCNRAGAVPADATEEEKKNNLYAIKIENATRLNFGYAEDKPVTAKAQIGKGGSLADKTITWTIDYTRWQNPAGGDGVTLDTSFELRDTIDASLHSYVDNSVTIDGRTVTAYASRSQVQGNEETYVIVEASADGGSTTLTFGGTKFGAGQATQGNPAKPLHIAYQTSINDELLLPGGTGGKNITNAADLFAGKDGVFNSMNISSSHTVPVSRPTWLTKEGKTNRNPGNGSTTEWTVTFQPNGFSFAADNSLTLHDQLPAGSTLVDGSVKVDGTAVTAVVTNNDFTISPITTKADDQPVVITYQSHVPEDMYDSGTSLGSNTAWFTFGRGKNGVEAETDKQSLDDRYRVPVVQ